MQQHNAQCCTPLCLGWMDWHHSAGGTPDTCGQFTSVNVSSQYLTDSSLTAARSDPENWQLIPAAPQTAFHQQLLTFTIISNRKAPLIFEDQLHKKQFQPKFCRYSRSQKVLFMTKAKRKLPTLYHRVHSLELLPLR